MKAAYFFICMCIFASELMNEISAFRVCGDTEQNEQVEPAVKEIVKRLMEARTPDWGWETFSTVITLQVSAPEKFFARDLTTHLLREVVEYDWDYLDVLDLAEFSFAARALCLDPEKISGKDLLRTISNEIGAYLDNSTTIEQDFIGEYSLVLSALCINHYHIEKRFVDKLLEMQNSDGSFGEPDFALDDTIWILRPFQCLTQMTDTTYNVTKVKEVVKKMREYIIKNIHKTRKGEVYIGEDEAMSNDAIIGLWYSKQPNESTSRWYCDEAMRTIGIHPKKGEDEETLGQRLLRITASDYLELHDKNYKCLNAKDIAPIPKGYRPICDYTRPDTCGGVVPKKRRKRSAFYRML
uniref:uncharacterized protein LOC120345533 isoform X1 n=2 Tax=Styela clava TaxID=7725 RepID=UPI00193A906D|nr:uncharacterized protein LOC120345533 isoform X1 [Styela clava]